MPTEDILSRAQRLEPAALTEIHDRYYPEIYRYISYRLGDEHVCEDIAAEVFLRLLDALHKKRGPAQNLRGWLFGTASNLVNDHLRKRYAWKVESLDMDDNSLPKGDHLEHSYEEEWMQQQVVHALQELTPEQQHVLALRFSDERSLEETASILGKSITAVKGLQFRAIATLRRLIDDRTKDS
jgi:RNA polymerase sigma-70 factor, ECF subfamily